MRRRLEELDRIDRDHGLGTLPTYVTHKRAQRRRGPVLPCLIIALTLTTFVMLRTPSTSGDRLRQLVGGDDQPLAGVVQGSHGRGTFAFALTQPGRQEPVSYNPCRPITYVVNPDGAPDGWETLVEQSVKAVSTATGFEFEYDGTTVDRRFQDRAGPLGTISPVLIGWATPDEFPRLDGDVAGLGGSSAIESTPGYLTYATGMVVLDRDQFAEIGAGSDGAPLQQAILEHEFGHVVGLAHVQDRSELMYGEAIARTTFGPGDLEGLTRLGAVPCG